MGMKAALVPTILMAVLLIVFDSATVVSELNQYGAPRPLKACR
jgi:hypothetical protein